MNGKSDGGHAIRPLSSYALVHCSSGIFPTMTLTNVFRQDEQNRILKNASNIIALAGEKRHLSCVTAEKPGEDFYFFKEDDSRRILDRIQKIVKTAIKEYHLPLESIAVLSPIHRGELGVDNLNAVLQNWLNPFEEGIIFNGREFRLHDKVIHTKNDPRLGVCNGEIGFVVKIGDSSRDVLTVAYSDKTVTYSLSKLSELDLAYAMTVHKMQGSECRLVVMPVSQNNLRIRSKSRRISKRGSPQLRRTLFQIASVILQHSKPDDPVFRFMDKKRAEGKYFYVYTVAGAAKFLRIYYARVKAYLKALDAAEKYVA